MTPRVFLIEPPKNHIDISACDSFGKVIKLYNGRERRPSLFNVKEFGDDVLRRLKLHEYEPMIDYICTAGSIIPVVLLVAAATSTWEQVRLLLFSAPEGKYLPRDIGLSIWDEANDV